MQKILLLLINIIKTMDVHYKFIKNEQRECIIIQKAEKFIVLDVNSPIHPSNLIMIYLLKSSFDNGAEIFIDRDYFFLEKL